MLKSRLAFFVLSGIVSVGCNPPSTSLYATISELGSEGGDMSGDMSKPPICPAATGLPGDILAGLCLDLAVVTDQSLIMKGFNLASVVTNCGGWEVKERGLQPKNIINAMGNDATCGLLFPMIVTNSYPRIILSIVHEGKLGNISQSGKISQSVTIWRTPNQDAFNQRTIIELTPSDTTIRPSIELGAPQNTGIPFWKISSIAVLGQPH